MDTGVFQTSENFVVRTYADMVYKIAVRYAGDLTDAEDVFSETFLTYFLKERTFSSEEHRKAWLIRVTINCAKDLLRGKGRTCEAVQETGTEERGFSEVENAADLSAALAQLKPEYREVICLHYLEDLPVKTIAEVLDRKESLVKTRLFRGRARLRAFLEASA